MSLTLNELVKKSAQELKRRQEQAAFEEISRDPQKYGYMTFQEFKKERQKANPLPKGRPKAGYVSHKKAYEKYLRNL